MILKIAMRNIFRHKTRSMITLSTIVFGCVALIFVAGFFEDAFLQMRETYISANLGHLQIYKEGFGKNGKINPYAYLIAKPEEVIKIIRQLPEVDSVTSRIQFSGLMSTGENTISFIGQGIDPSREKTLGPEYAKDIRKMYNNGHINGLPVMEQGRGLNESDKYCVILGKGLAADIGGTVGASVTLLANTVNGSTNALDMKINGIFRTSSESFDDIFLRMPLVIAQKLLDTQSVQAVVVKIHRTDDTAEVKEKLEHLFRENHLDLELKSWEELSDFYTKTVNLFDMFHVIMGTVVLIVVILGIFNTMNMAVMERISEIGTMMALGLKQTGVLQLFLCEGLFLGLIGGTIGIIAGCFILHGISYVGILMPPAPGQTIYWLSHPTIIPKALINTFFLSISMGGISSLYPAFKASRLVIAEALRYR